MIMNPLYKFSEEPGSLVDAAQVIMQRYTRHKMRRGGVYNMARNDYNQNPNSNDIRRQIFARGYQLGFANKIAEELVDKSIDKKIKNVIKPSKTGKHTGSILNFGFNIATGIGAARKTPGLIV